MPESSRVEDGTAAATNESALTPRRLERHREFLRVSLGLAMAFSRMSDELLSYHGGRCVAPALSGEPVAIRTRHWLADTCSEAFR